MTSGSLLATTSAIAAMTATAVSSRARHGFFETSGPTTSSTLFETPASSTAAGLKPRPRAW